MRKNGSFGRKPQLLDCLWKWQDKTLVAPKPKQVEEVVPSSKQNSDVKLHVKNHPLETSLK